MHKRGSATKTKDMMQKEMLVAKTFAEKAITYVEDIKLRFKESDRHTEDLAAINYDYLHALVLLAISLGHLSFPEEATATMSKCFDIIENEIRVVDESGAEITAKAFRKHAMGLKNRLGVASQQILMVHTIKHTLLVLMSFVKGTLMLEKVFLKLKKITTTLFSKTT